MPALGPLAALDEALLRMVIDLRWAPLTWLMTLLSAWWVNGIVIGAVGALVSLPGDASMPSGHAAAAAAAAGVVALSPLGLAIASIVVALARRVVRRRREDGAVIEAGAGAG